MKLVRAALGHQRHLAARRTPLAGSLSRNGCPKLLHGIQGHGKRGAESAGAAPIVGGRVVAVGRNAVLIVVHVDAVERDVVLVLLGADNFAGRRDAGLQAQQLDNVPRLQRKLADLSLSERVADGRVLHVDRRRFAENIHGLGQRAHFQFDVHRSRRIDLKPDPRREGREAGKLGLNFVCAGRKLRESVAAHVVRNSRAHGVGV